VYVNKNGWVLAYYLAADPAAKIFDWRAYHDSGRTTFTTKLETAITAVAGAANVPFSASNATYYDFRYPNATNLMLIIEWVLGQGTDSFQAKLPGTFTYYERSWSLGNSYGRYSDPDASYKLNGTIIQTHQGYDWCTSQGTLTAVQLPPDQFNTVEIFAYYNYGTNHAYGGLALVYRVP
jgi:hypothetical protein